MRIGSFQFAASADIDRNRRAIERGLRLAQGGGVALLLTQECGLTGYPPVETPSVAAIDQQRVQAALAALQATVAQCGVALCVGAVFEAGGHAYNSMFVLFPDGRAPVRYDKRALWGWDLQNFRQGEGSGLFDYGGLRLGLRICFEVRFPEFFRELFDARVDVALVAFCDVSAQANATRREIIRGHLVTRAVENAFTLVSANGLGAFQTAPTCVLSADGVRLAEAPEEQEALIFHDFAGDAGNYGRTGRVAVSQALRAPGATESDDYFRGALGGLDSSS